ncbi:MAG TPA: SpoIIE family protein phosphatase [Acidimicrobiales bacterium]|nr:SpoIIE family protein phosphatase [Acidimicrobiales bacterium]
MRGFVGSFGRPGMRDLDFGRQLVECLQELDLPAGVVVEILPCSAPLVLNRLQELRPARVVLLGAVARGDDAGTVRRYRLVDMSLVDLDHTLAFARQWGGLPADTVVIEVEPDEIELAPGFSDALAGAFDPVLDMVREELDDLPEEPPAPAPAEVDQWNDLVTYAHDHQRSRRSRSSPAPVEGVDLAGRVRPWGVFTESGGDWFDAIPLAGDKIGIVVGDVPGRGVEMAVAMSELRAAVQAYVVMDGTAPAAVVGHLDRLARATGVGRDARLIYAVLDPAGVVELVNAGGCPPLLLEPIAGTRFVDDAMSVPVGEAGGDRPVATLDLGLRSTLLLYTGGLVESRKVPRAIGMERLRQVAGEAPFALDALCDRVLSACTDGLRRDDDICLLAVRP